MLRISFILLILFPGCALYARMPKDRPADFQVQVEYDGVMMDVFKRYTVRGDSTIFEVKETGISRRLAFATPSQPLDSLYAHLRKLNFTRVRSLAGVSYPWSLGGHRVQLQANTECSSFSSTAGNLIDPHWKTAFNEGVHAVIEFVSTRLDAFQKEVQLEIQYSDDLIDLRALQLSMGDHFDERWRVIEARDRPAFFVLQALPGPHVLTGYIQTGEEMKEFTHFVEVGDGPNIFVFKSTREGLLRLQP